jgi:3',5'-cyclic AMP phosphodiesterase CpdA
MNHWLPYLLIAALLAGSVPAAGQTIEKIPWDREQVLAEYPSVISVEEGRARLRFATVRPVVTRVHYGGYPTDQDLCLPLYRFSAEATLVEGGYEAVLRIYRFSRDTYNMAKGSALEGVVPYRLEIMDQETGTMRYFENRFRFRREETDNGEIYRLLPCLVEGPMVDRVSDRMAVISFDVDSACYAGVRLGDDLVLSRGPEGQPWRARHHEIVLDGLDPAGEYDYTVVLAGDAEFAGDVFSWPQRRFRTAPEPGSRRPFSFAFLSDSRQAPGGGEYGFGGCNYRSLQPLMMDLYRRGANLVLFGGDLINGYTSSRRSFLRQLRTWKKAVEMVGSFIPIYEGMGNHEQVGEYLKVDIPGEKVMTVYTDRAARESAEALFASQFVNPVGSHYGFGLPEPEEQWPEVGRGWEELLAPLNLPLVRGPSYRENVYSFNYDNVHFVSLNSNYWHSGVYYGSAEMVSRATRIVGGSREGYIMAHQLNWLRKDLDAAQADETIDWVVLFTHEPAFPAGGHLRDAMFWGQKKNGRMVGLNDSSAPSGDIIDMRDRFWTLISSYPKVLAAMFGDEHNYSRTYIDDSIHPDYEHPVWQIVSGGAGAPFYGQDPLAPWMESVRHFTSLPHYCLVTVHGREVRIEVWSRSAELIEEVVLSDLPR